MSTTDQNPQNFNVKRSQGFKLWIYIDFFFFFFLLLGNDSLKMNLRNRIKLWMQHFHNKRQAVNGR